MADVNGPKGVHFPPLILGNFYFSTKIVLKMADVNGPKGVTWSNGFLMFSFVFVFIFVSGFSIISPFPFFSLTCCSDQFFSLNFVSSLFLLAVYVYCFLVPNLMVLNMTYIIVPRPGRTTPHTITRYKVTWSYTLIGWPLRVSGHIGAKSIRQNS